MLAMPVANWRFSVCEPSQAMWANGSRPTVSGSQSVEYPSDSTRPAISAACPALMASVKYQIPRLEGPPVSRSRALIRPTLRNRRRPSSVRMGRSRDDGAAENHVCVAGTSGRPDNSVTQTMDGWPENHVCVAGTLGRPDNSVTQTMDGWPGACIDRRYEG